MNRTAPAAHLPGAIAVRLASACRACASAAPARASAAQAAASAPA